MRHKVKGRKLGRTAAHKRAVGRNLVISLFQHERIETTAPKAKEFRSLAERLITLAKKGPSLHNYRQVASVLQNRVITRKLFREIAPLFANRKGGYTRILKLPRPRLGDCGDRVIFELVEKTPQKIKEDELRKELLEKKKKKKK